MWPTVIGASRVIVLGAVIAFKNRACAPMPFGTPPDQLLAFVQLPPPVEIHVGPLLTNHGWLYGELSMKLSNIVPTFCSPDCEGCVRSPLSKSLIDQVSPSERGVVPSAHKYGPHASHGAVPLL